MLHGNRNRQNIIAFIAECRRDSDGNWEYKLKLKNGTIVLKGDYFSEDEISYAS